ncbi:hypothetical protein K439DRAFT_1377937 [Ramaria rubella]|nr:hypothetical protein K439DRAFT_1377937 [Ramaria rubella]
MLLTFETALAYICDAKFVPVDMGVRPDEWEDSYYPPYEALKVGGTRDTIISLPPPVWLPRAI